MSNILFNLVRCETETILIIESRLIYNEVHFIVRSHIECLKEKIFHGNYIFFSEMLKKCNEIFFGRRPRPYTYYKVPLWRKKI